MLLTATSFAWLASCAVAAAVLALILVVTRATLTRIRGTVDPAAWVLAASVVGGSVSVLALALLSN